MVAVRLGSGKVHLSNVSCRCRSSSRGMVTPVIRSWHLKTERQHIRVFGQTWFMFLCDGARFWSYR